MDIIQPQTEQQAFAAKFWGSQMFKLPATSLRAAVAVASFLSAPVWAQQPVAVPAERVVSFETPDARQAVAVDDRFFYAI